MASLGCARCASRNFSLHFYFYSLTRRFFSSKHKNLKKFKNRRNPKISDFNVQEVLQRGKAVDQGSVDMSGGTAQAMETTSNNATTTNNKNSWQHSNERLGYLKTSEKRVAVIAVLTMLFGYFGIKWMASRSASPSIEGEESPSTNESTVQPAS